MQIPLEGDLRDLSMDSLILIRFPPHLGHDFASAGNLNLSFGQKNVPEMFNRALPAGISFLTAPSELWQGVQNLSSLKRVPNLFFALSPVLVFPDIRFSFFV
jgi:hypothetical protein